MKDYFNKLDKETKQSMYQYWAISCSLILVTVAVCWYFGI